MLLLIPSVLHSRTQLWCTSSWTHLRQALILLDRYGPDAQRGAHLDELEERVQGPHESVAKYATDVAHLAERCGTKDPK